MSAPSSTTTVPAEAAQSRARRAELDHALDVFQAERGRLVWVARRIVGDLASSEDVVQEVWLRWQRTDRSRVENPEAFLTTTPTRLSINVIQSAYHRHEASTESLVSDLADPRQDPPTRVEQAAVVEETLWCVMAKLTRSELAAYVLRRGFDCPYGHIAGLLSTSAENARQLVRRAQVHLRGDRECVPDRDEHRTLVRSFLRAARTGELDALEQVLAVRTVPSRAA